VRAVLNADVAPGDAGDVDPVELSRQLLGIARKVEAGEAELAELQRLAAALRGVEPAALGGDDARIAFWVNLYNALFRHRLCRRPIRGSVLRHLRLFSATAYEVGGERFSLNLIEHGVLRRNRRPPYHPRRSLRPGDPRLAALPSRLDPRIHFALNCGARSCPPIHTYDPATVDEQLELATRAYLAAETEVDTKHQRIALPRLMRLYRTDFGGRDAQLSFAAGHLDQVRALLADGAPRLRYRSFDWTAAPHP